MSRRQLLLFAATPYDGARLYDQRIAQALADEGLEVIYVEPPIPVLVRREWQEAPESAEPRVVGPGLRVFTPRMLPKGLRNPLAPLTAYAVAWQVRRWVDRTTLKPFVLILSAHSILARQFADLPSIDVVLDDYVSGAGLIGLSSRSVLRQRRALSRVVPQSAVVSEHLAQVLLREGVRAAVVPAGCELIASDLPASARLDDVPHPRAVFSGMLSNRIDFAFLKAVVDAGVHLVMVGRQQPGFSEQQEYDALVASGRVTDLGELGRDEVEAVMVGCDVGLVPYVLSDFNLASFPLKTFEYLAAGLPVVSSALPGILALDEPCITVVGSAEAAGPAAAEGARTRTDPDVREACREVARRNSWSVRAQQLLALFEAQLEHHREPHSAVDAS